MNGMEETIKRLEENLTLFCNHLQSSCDALNLSLHRRPIPLDSASSTFIQSLNRRVSAASADLNLLDSMSFGTVSFEELLGHCNEVYKHNHSALSHLRDHLKSSTLYVDDDDDDDEECTETTLLATYPGSSVSAAATSVINTLEDDDPLMDESLSLKSLGLSDVCLATLEANSKIHDDLDIFMSGPLKHYGDKQLSVSVRIPHQISAKSLGANEGVEDDLKTAEDDDMSLVEVSKDDYDDLPSYMKSLASWEDVLAAVEKINSSLRKKGKTKGCNYFLQDEIASLELGPKARTYLLLLMRMNQLVVETIDGLISYKVLSRR